MSELCRLCITECNETVNLTEYREGLPISVITMIILPIKIQPSEDLSLPQKICSNCLEIILNAYKLRFISLSSENYLKSNLYEPELNIKSEFDESSTIFIESNDFCDDDERPVVKKKSKPTYNCDSCHRTFKSKSLLASHYQNDHGDEQFDYQIPTGDENFSESLRIDFYKKDKTPKASLAWRYFGRLTDESGQQVCAGFHYCSLCLESKKLTKYRTSTATSTILFHLNSVHGIGRDEDGSEVTTNVAKEKYFQRNSMKRSRSSGNASEMVGTICSVCGKVFSSHHILNKHMRLHSGNSYPCDQCPAKFTYPENLQRHQKVHDPNHLSRYVCDTCGSSYAELKSLRSHIMRVHLNIPVEKNFACTFDGCSMKFAIRYNLKKHMMTHTDLKPHECQFCGAAYASKGDLFKHLQRSHVGDALYTCEHCNATFKFKVQLREHYKVHYKTEQTEDEKYGECSSSGY